MRACGRGHCGEQLRKTFSSPKCICKNAKTFSVTRDGIVAQHLYFVAHFRCGYHWLYYWPTPADAMRGQRAMPRGTCKGSCTLKSTYVGTCSGVVFDRSSLFGGIHQIHQHQPGALVHRRVPASSCSARGLRVGPFVFVFTFLQPCLSENQLPHLA